MRLLLVVLIAYLCCLWLGLLVFLCLWLDLLAILIVGLGWVVVFVGV